MRSGVGRIGELAGDEAVGGLSRQLLGLGDGTLHALGTLGQHKLGTVGLQQVAAFHAHGLRHGEDDPVSPGGGHGGQANAGVSAGRLNDHGVRLQNALGFGIVDHGSGHSILDTASRIEVLQLAVNGGFQMIQCDVIGQLQKRRAADKVCDPVVGFHGCDLLWE